VDEDMLLADLYNAIDTIGRQVRIELPDGRFVTGRATALGTTGSLIVDTGHGTEELVAGDVTHLRLGSDESVR
jgi:BirA family biotin operon repressor/biotin-[acetyl-CoA-carboxylase] ligase